MINFLEGLEGFNLALFIKVTEWFIKQLQIFLMDVRKDIENRKIYDYYDLVAVIGQKTF